MSLLESPRYTRSMRTMQRRRKTRVTAALAVAIVLLGAAGWLAFRALAGVERPAVADSERPTPSAESTPATEATARVVPKPGDNFMLERG